MNRFSFVSLLASSCSISLSMSGCASQNPPTVPASPTEPTAAPAAAPVAAPVLAPTSGAPKQLTWSIAGTFPHDPSAFTEGLFWKDGQFLESTGLEGKSDVRRVDPATGQVLQRFVLPSQYFGEGLSFIGGHYFYMTWQTKIGFVLDPNFKPIAKFSYQDEGWGLTNDGQKMLQSDGTDTLTWRSPKDFSSLGEIKVTRAGLPLKNINELEWINGYVWANVWQTDDIVVIDPKTGKVVAQLDLSGLLSPADRKGGEDVLNGIAYDAKTDRIFVTGKNWPKLFWLSVPDAPGAKDEPNANGKAAG